MNKLVSRYKQKSVIELKEFLDKQETLTYEGKIGLLEGLKHGGFSNFDAKLVNELEVSIKNEDDNISNLLGLEDLGFRYQEMGPNRFGFERPRSTKNMETLGWVLGGIMVVFGITVGLEKLIIDLDFNLSDMNFLDAIILVACSILLYYGILFFYNNLIRIIRFAGFNLMVKDKTIDLAIRDGFKLIKYEFSREKVILNESYGVYSLELNGKEIMNIKDPGLKQFRLLETFYAKLKGIS